MASEAESLLGTQGLWSGSESAELYRIESWGDPYFFVNELGHVGVRSLDERGTEVDLPAIVSALRQRGVKLPALVRFQDILRSRVMRLNDAFIHAIEESGYGNVYRGVYPIKVNQLHEVVDELLDAGRPYSLGLECGSKAELIAALPQVGSDTLLICNGIKDQSMLALMLSAQRLGQSVVPVVERYREFDDACALGRANGEAPRLGVRVRLSTRGSGRWSESSGVNSKFGLTMVELERLVSVLEQDPSAASLVLLHCHIGSQISDIQVLKQATKEVARIYAELIHRGIAVEYLDVGGGLGVNYDPGQVEEDAGINYSLQEYANAVVFSVKEVCEAQQVPEPIIITESGRALTAHHSVLIVPVLGAHSKQDASLPIAVPDDSAEPLLWLNKIASYLPTITGIAELREAFHDASEHLEEARSLFSLGYLDLKQRALVDSVYWGICAELLVRLGNVEDVDVPELAELESLLTDQYLCDFSVFQSMLDHWAIGQPFPIMPITRLNEQPGRRGILVDLTCDSDGKVRHYVSSLDDNGFLPLHPIMPDEPYYLGFFLMGAYEDIVGDAHNLFGRVTEAHVYADADEPGGFWIEKIITGTAVQDMLAQVQYFPNDLHRRMSELVRGQIRAGVIRPTQGMQILDQYMACFSSSTYCETSETTDEKTK
jgi:arginine decarboxylase